MIDLEPFKRFKKQFSTEEALTPFFTSTFLLIISKDLKKEHLSKNHF